MSIVHINFSLQQAMHPDNVFCIARESVQKWIASTTRGIYSTCLPARAMVLTIALSSVSVGSEFVRSNDGSVSQSLSREEAEHMEAMEEERARHWRLTSVLKWPPRHRLRLSSMSSDSPPAVSSTATATRTWNRAPSARDAFCECNALLD
jgi:hypothetical protein